MALAAGGLPLAGPAAAQGVALPNVSRAWQWQDPRPSGFNIEAIHAFSARAAVAVGQGGTVLLTADSGRTWQSQRSGTTEALTTVSFADSLRGWAGGTAQQVNVRTAPWPGPGAVRRTVDGGRTWTRQLIGDNRVIRILAVQAPTPTTCYVLYDALVCRVGQPCGGVPEMGLRRTTDGGATWQSVNSSLPFLTRPTLQFFSATVGYLTADFFFRPSNILKTTDGGVTWRNISPDSTTVDVKFFGGKFADAQHGWAVGGGGVVPASIWRTTDGGRTWGAPQQVYTPGTTDLYPFPHLLAADARHVLLVPGYDGSGLARPALLSADSGATWQTGSTSPFSRGHKPGHMTPDGGVWLPAADGFPPPDNMHSADFGRTWRSLIPRLSPSRYYSYWGPQIFDATRVWITPHNDSALLYSADRGEHWRRVPLAAPAINWHFRDSPPLIHGSSFVDRDTGFVHVRTVDPFFRTPQHWVLATTDGGAHWAATALPLTNRWLFRPDISFVTARQGIVVGDGGLILRTHDAGQTWQRVPSGTTHNLYGISWRDAQHGVIGGDSVTLLATADAGQSWQPVRLDSLQVFDHSVPPRPITRALLPAGSGGFSRVHFEDSLHWYGGDKQTSDGGHNWQIGYYSNPSDLDDYGGVGGRTNSWRRGRSLGMGKNPWRTDNGGLSWQRLALTGGAAVQTIADAYNGWGALSYIGFAVGIVHYSEKFIQTDTALTQLTYCTGDTVAVGFDTVGVFAAAERDFRVEVSNRMGRFRVGQTVLAPVVGSATASPLRVRLPASLVSGSGYRLRVIRADSSVLGGDNARDLTIWSRPAAAVTPTGPQTICQGDSVQLRAPAGFAAYAWTTGATTASVWVRAAGAYAVRVAHGGGCFGPASAPVTVSVTPRPALPTITVQTPGSGIVILTSSSATGNQWLLNGTPISGATNPTYTASTAAQSGTYTVVVTRNGCASPASAVQSVVVTGLDAEAARAGLTLHPNPATTAVVLRCETGLRLIVVRDLAGRVVLHLPGAGRETVVPLAAVPAGSYLVESTLTDGRVLTRRLLVSR